MPSGVVPSHTGLVGLERVLWRVYSWNDTARYAGRASSAELIERNLRLGLEFDLLGNTSLLAALGILGSRHFSKQVCCHD